jgi:hypothetical protein
MPCAALQPTSKRVGWITDLLALDCIGSDEITANMTDSYHEHDRHKSYRDIAAQVLASYHELPYPSATPEGEFHPIGTLRASSRDGPVTQNTVLRELLLLPGPHPPLHATRVIQSVRASSQSRKKCTARQMIRTQPAGEGFTLPHNHQAT